MKLGSLSTLIAPSTMCGFDLPLLRLSTVKPSEDHIFGVPQPMRGQMLTQATPWLQPETLPPYNYNPDESRRLLKQAGIDKLTTKMEFTITKPSDKAFAEHLRIT